MFGQSIYSNMESEQTQYSTTRSSSREAAVVAHAPYGQDQQRKGQRYCRTHASVGHAIDTTSLLASASGYTKMFHDVLAPVMCSANSDENRFSIKQISPVFATIPPR